MGSTHVTGSVEKFGGEMSAGELQFFRHVRGLIRATIDGRALFAAAMTTLQMDFREIRKNEFDVDAALAAGWEPAAAQTQPASSPRLQPSDAERTFLEDMDGLLDFATRNGLTFFWVLRAVMHDVTALAGYEWRMDKAADDFFSPTVTGWANRNSEPFGEADTGAD